MIENYNPWGRKGGGAPNRSIRMSNIYQEGLYPEPKTVSCNFKLVVVEHCSSSQLLFAESSHTD